MKMIKGFVAESALSRMSMHKQLGIPQRSTVDISKPTIPV
jgi:hypothetical protein